MDRHKKLARSSERAIFCIGRICRVHRRGVWNCPHVARSSSNGAKRATRRHVPPRISVAVADRKRGGRRKLNVARLTHVAARRGNRGRRVRDDFGRATWRRSLRFCPRFLGYLTIYARGCRICVFRTCRQVRVFRTRMSRRNRAPGRDSPARVLAKSSRVLPITPSQGARVEFPLPLARPAATPARGRARRGGKVQPRLYFGARDPNSGMTSEFNWQRTYETTILLKALRIWRTLHLRFSWVSVAPEKLDIHDKRIEF